jgi:spore coat protein Z
MLDNHSSYGDFNCRCGQNSHDQKDCCQQHKHFKTCVDNVLENIVKAQEKAKRSTSCTNSCQKSIEGLLGKKKKITKNTIPFILFCGCKPFKGTGVLTYSCQSKNKKLKCIHSFIFKIKELKKGCAVLELLIFKSDLRNLRNNRAHHQSTPCCQLDHKNLNDLMRTGICINVDLSNFSAITCLPAVYL